MDIRVGRVAEAGGIADQSGRAEGVTEARVLDVRAPRRQVGRKPANAPERRDHTRELDPPGARVLLLLVPEGAKVPPDLESGSYRVFLRFARR
jgi:hypothetical protein